MSMYDVGCRSDLRQRRERRQAEESESAGVVGIVRVVGAVDAIAIEKFRVLDQKDLRPGVSLGNPIEPRLLGAQPQGAANPKTRSRRERIPAPTGTMATYSVGCPASAWKVRGRSRPPEPPVRSSGQYSRSGAKHRSVCCHGAPGGPPRGSVRRRRAAGDNRLTQRGRELGTASMKRADHGRHPSFSMTVDSGGSSCRIAGSSRCHANVAPCAAR